MIIFVCGENSYQSMKRLTILVDDFKSRYGDINYESIDSDVIDKVINFFNNLEAIPFLSEKRMIVIKGLLANKKMTAFKDKLLSFMPKLPDFTIVVFYENSEFDKRQSLYKFLKKEAKVEEFKFFTPKDLNNFIIANLARDNISINNDELLILSHIWKSRDVWSLINELDKLKLYLIAEKRNLLTKEDIKKIVSVTNETKIFDLIDLIGKKKQSQALKEISALLESGESEFYIHTMIVYQFRNLLMIKAMTYSNAIKEDIQKTLKLHPFVISKGLDQVKNYTFEELKEIYRKLLEIEIEIKTGKIDANLALSTFVASVSN